MLEPLAMGRVRRAAAPGPISSARDALVEPLPSGRAVLVVHGMGQQVRFQALDQIAQGLLREAGGSARNPVAGGALRYSFGRAHTISPSFSSVIALGSAVGVLLTLVAMNGVLLALAALEGLEPGFVSGPLKARLAEGAPALLAILAAFSLATKALLLALVGVEWVKRRTARVDLGELWRVLGAVLHALFLVWLCLTLVAGLAALVLVSGFGPVSWIRDTFSCAWLSKHWMLPLTALLLASVAVRRLFVQYLGDVAAYVASYTLDRFTDVRNRIKEIARKTAAALFEATVNAESNVWAYDGVAVVAHSLGSVVAYDALNALLVDDTVSAEKRDISARTRLFLTFGSPLEKTAFLFASQAKRTTDAREALVASLQPLISDYRFRPFRWVNVFSRRDPISGRLMSYDDSSQPLYRERRIRNLPDRAAVLPLLAHLEYFSDPQLIRQLVRALR